MAFIHSIFVLTIAFLVSGNASEEKRKNLETGLCLDSDGDRNAYTKECNAGDYQRWRIDKESDGRYATFTNVATGFCLDSNDSGEVYTKACNGGYYQKWQLGNRMRNKQTGRCLDSNRSKQLYAIGCNGGDFQYWYHRFD
jgi:hypothetical protein